MKVRLLLKRNYSKQYSLEEWAMGTECKTVIIDLPDISNEDAVKHGIGEWQIVGYEEIEASK